MLLVFYTSCLNIDQQHWYMNLLFFLQTFLQLLEKRTLPFQPSSISNLFENSDFGIYQNRLQFHLIFLKLDHRDLLHKFLLKQSAFYLTVLINISTCNSKTYCKLFLLYKLLYPRNYNAIINSKFSPYV